jgi:hypothetical protein
LPGGPTIGVTSNFCVDRLGDFSRDHKTDSRRRNALNDFFTFYRKSNVFLPTGTFVPGFKKSTPACFSAADDELPFAIKRKRLPIRRLGTGGDGLTRSTGK